MCDPAHLQQAFLNVLINAEHAVLSGGAARRIEIRTGTRKNGTQVVVTIRDHGPGIAADVLPKIFDPFFTTKDVGEGSGLGLSIVHGIVDRHGGRIMVESQVGEGTTFRIVLPVRSAAAATSAPPS